MKRPGRLRASTAAVAVAATLIGCGDVKNQRESTTPIDASKPASPAIESPSPALGDQPAASTKTPSEAAKDESKASAGEANNAKPPESR